MRITKPARPVAFTIILVAFTTFVSCRGREESAGETDSAGLVTRPTADSGTVDLGALSDPNRYSVLALINGEEILAAQAAERKARSDDVKQFAQDMIRDHRAFQHAADSLALAKNVTPVSPPVVDSMQARMKSVRDSIGGLTGAEFDRAYMQSQVQAHQQALGAIRSLAGAAQDTTLRNLLERGSETVQDHLERARSISAGLGGKTS